MDWPCHPSYILQIFMLLTSWMGQFRPHRIVGRSQTVHQQSPRQSPSVSLLVAHQMFTIIAGED